jgi:porin
MQSFSGRYGFYVTAAQTLWRVAGDTPGDTRSFSVFGAVDVGDPQTSLYRVYAEVGAVLKGTFPGRDDDTIGFAVTDTEVNQSRAEEESMLLSDGVAITGTQTREVAFELNYAAAVYRGVSIEPGVQVVLHPDALNEIPDALVFDLRTAVKF